MPKRETRICAWVPLPTPGAPRRRIGPGKNTDSAGAGMRAAEFEVNVSCLPTSAPTNATALGREAVIMAHDELRFYLLDGVHGYANHDQKRGAAEVKGETKPVG